jgi:hypothetical protein
MSIRNALVISATSLALALGAGFASAQTTSAQVSMNSPTEVQRALTVLNRVVDHTKRLIAAKNYAQLSRENTEFNDGSQALERSIAKEPGPFKTQVGSLLRKADSDSKNLADASRTPDTARLEAIQGELAGSVKQIFAMFPASVQPSPPSLTQQEQEDRTGTTGSGR